MGAPTWVLTRDGVATDDVWPIVDDAAGVGPSEPALLPLCAYVAQPQSAAHGVWLAPTDDPAPLTAHFDAVPLIAIGFPKSADGRGYSLAALLRGAGYRGDLRAFGDIGVDHLHMLRRVGFSSFELRIALPLAEARAALRRYSDAYQGAADEPLPAYRRAPRATGTS